MRHGKVPGRAPSTARARVAQPSSVVAQPAPDIFAALEQLGELHGKGILSDEEFASKKAELLDRF